ncbi:hypothetical protein ACFYXV_32315 [Streptomyces sp. NPDC002181]|uniref:hypothetical protein n=1 Tax=Streptomyces sp. NPDC002181 TaxID=3364635 RepID=UPI003696F28F
MSETNNQTRRRPPARASRTGTAVCAFVLALGHVAAGYLELLAYAVEPAGPWDSEAVTHSHYAAGLALTLTVVTALSSWVFVKAEWLRRWWLAVPPALALAAIVRLTVLTPGL